MKQTSLDIRGKGVARVANSQHSYFDNSSKYAHKACTHVLGLSSFFRLQNKIATHHISEECPGLITVMHVQATYHAQQNSCMDTKYCCDDQVINIL